MVEWVSIGRPVFWWTGRTLAKGKPLPGSSSCHWRGQVHLAPCDKPWGLTGRVGMVIRAPVTLGVASQSQVEAQAHVGAAVLAGAGHGWQANRGEDIPNASLDSPPRCQSLLRGLIPAVGAVTGRPGCRHGHRHGHGGQWPARSHGGLSPDDRHGCQSGGSGGSRDVGCWDPRVPRIVKAEVLEELLQVRRGHLDGEPALILKPHVQVQLHPLHHVERGESWVLLKLCLELGGTSLP
jgi:hypothetical protein